MPPCSSGDGSGTRNRAVVLARLRPTLTFPGASVQRMFNPQLAFHVTFETRFLPETPSLSRGLEPRTIQVFGAILKWTVGW